jgi:hypothetical protein
MIEKNVPMPNPRSGSAKYEFAKMEVGDSVLDKTARSTDSSKMYVAAKVYGYRTGRKYIGRKEADGVRIWRSK